MMAVSPSAARRLLVRLLRRSELNSRPATCFELRWSQLLTADHRFGPKSPLETPITLNAQDTLTVSLTAKDSGKAKRPHQAFLLLKDESGLEAPFPLSVKDSGKAKVQIVRSFDAMAKRYPPTGEANKPCVCRRRKTFPSSSSCPRSLSMLPLSLGHSAQRRVSLPMSSTSISSRTPTHLRPSFPPRCATARSPGSTTSSARKPSTLTRYSRFSSCWSSPLPCPPFWLV